MHPAEPLQPHDEVTDVAPLDAPRRERKRRSFWAELPFLLIAALTVAVLIKSFLIQPFYIPSGSMVPTILVNDRVMVSKLNYRFGEPQRGDIVVFHSPYNDVRDSESIPELVVRHVLEAVGIRTAATDEFIKRVVGLPGETIEVRGNVVFIDGQPLSEPYLPPGTRMPDMAPQEIPADHVFVMGDNREGSSDSRKFGPIPTSDIVGEAVLRIWPPSRLGGL